MSDTALVGASEGVGLEKTRSLFETLSRVAKYTLVRLVFLFLTVVVGVYLVVIVANMGGYVDEIRRGNIHQMISLEISQDESPEMRALSTEAKQALIRERVAIEVKRQGLDRPFIVRSFDFLRQALTLNLGFASDMVSDTGSKQVKLILLERLPPTLLLWGAANVTLFFASLFFGLFLSRKYGSWLDRFVVAMAPTSSAPAWFYGLFLILVFAALLQILPFGGMVAAPPPESKILYALSVLKHLILPTSAIVISSVFLQTFNFRTFFLIYSSEDYVEMAKAKGLSDREIERRYVLRPVLPTIITQFALLLIAVWMGATILETVFNWPGLGRTLFRAIGLFDTSVIVGSQVIFAYLLAGTVFLLDIIYALVDPRVRIGAEGRTR
ncbi:MAG TPA: ABC transporter permease [Chloroflexi bacterium]|nr:ABC transporter permease [Chloroflexota bacterium]